MDSTLVAVIIGGLLTLFGNAITQWLASRKEEKHWLRQQEAEAKKLEREEKKAERTHVEKEKAYVREIYLNSIQSLSALAATEINDGEEKPKISGDKRLELIEEAHKWLALLTLRNGQDYSFLAIMRDFTRTPDDYASQIRDTVVELANNDREVSPPKPEKPKVPVKESGAISFQFGVDREFRRQQLIGGKELPQSYAFNYSISKLTSSQRQKLVDTYFDSRNGIPEQINLAIPTYNPLTKTINYSGEAWRAKLDPLSTQPEDVLNSWEDAFNKSFEGAHKEQRK